MNKYVKLFSAFAICSILVGGFISCSNDDGYSLDKYWENFATVSGDGANTSFTLDDGTTLFVASSATNYKPRNKRVIINYTILSDNYGGYDHAIKLNGYRYDVLTKGVVYIAPDNVAKQDSIGNDPIGIISIWEGGGYLNIRFKYNEGDVYPHMLNLVSADSDLSVNDDVVKLEFRHNNQDDPAYRPVTGYVSFDLAPYRIANRDKVNFEVAVKELNGEIQIYTLEYTYDGVLSPN